MSPSYRCLLDADRPFMNGPPGRLPPLPGGRVDGRRDDQQDRRAQERTRGANKITGGARKGTGQKRSCRLLGPARRVPVGTACGGQLRALTGKREPL